MDTLDDPSSTTTTTDYDSGDSEGVDYVYESQRCAEKKYAKPRGPKKKSPKAKPRGAAKCVCGAARRDDDGEVTVFEDDTDTEEDQGHRSRRPKPRPSGPDGASKCGEKELKRIDKKGVEKKYHRAQSPYIEEYPDETPRPSVLLKEHKIPRRFSASDTLRTGDVEGVSPSSDSRGRSPGKHLLRVSHGSPKASSRRSEHRRRRLNFPREHEGEVFDSDVEDLQPHAKGVDPPTARLHGHEQDGELIPVIARSSVWADTHQPKYSSSWPQHAGTHLSQKQPRHHRSQETDEEIEEHPFNNSNNFDDHGRLRQAPAASSRSKDRDNKVREKVEGQRERSRQRLRPRTIVSRSSMATMDRGGQSVATELCEVWCGRQEDWESPYVSGIGSDCDEYYSDVGEPMRLLRPEDLPPRTSSPCLLPPRGERRDFGFQVMSRSPPPFRYARDPSPAPCASLYRNRAWRGPGQCLLLEGPPVLTTEPDVMGEEEMDDFRAPSRASRWSKPGSSRGWTDPGPPRPLSRSRAVSPIFSARKTREFLSPKPTRAARFDFGAWGCDRASRSSLSLSLF